MLKLLAIIGTALGAVGFLGGKHISSVQLNPFFIDGFETGNTVNWNLVTSGGGVEP